MWIQLLIFIIWAGIGALAYFLISPLAVVIYGVVTMVGYLIYAGTRKGPNLNNRP